MKYQLWIWMTLVGTGSMAQVAEKPQDIAPLLISEKLPNTKVTTLEGKSEPLIELLGSKKSILLFYRGGWCPYCNAHLSAVGQAKKEINELGYQVVGIAPDSPDQLKASIEKTEIDYLLYSDADGSLITAMGLAYQAPERYNNRLDDYSGGQNPGLLPVPALFVVDAEGTILFEYISPDYQQRISPELLLDVLRNLSKEGP